LIGFGQNVASLKFSISYGFGNLCSVYTIRVVCSVYSLPNYILYPHMSTIAIIVLQTTPQTPPLKGHIILTVYIFSPP